MYHLVEQLRRRTPQLDTSELHAFVRSFHERRDLFLKVREAHGSPLYVLEETILLERAARFKAAFERSLHDIKVFYAVKSNNHPAVAKILVRAGLGLDVSSGEELKLALGCGAQSILFSGPGKSNDELELAAESARRVTVLCDSENELERLAHIARRIGTVVRCGVRLTTDETGIWRKFGIPLSRLSRVFHRARAYPSLRLCGVQFHLSWNLSPDNHTVFLARLGAAIRTLDKQTQSVIEFIDIGGGFWPPQGEWLQGSATPEGRLQHELLSVVRTTSQHYRLPAVSIEDFAHHIAQAIRTQIYPDISCCIYMEPGRWICNDAMHVLLTVADRKSQDLVITDGGINIVGWERFESDYCPIINLSRPALMERECLVAGSLCTPHDIWGYGYFGEEIRRGDVLLVPHQGAYTYSLRQQFIKPIPEVCILKDGGDHGTQETGDHAVGARQ
jgi:diaminopimelate decarboxylase